MDNEQFIHELIKREFVEVMKSVWQFQNESYFIGMTDVDKFGGDGWACHVGEMIPGKNVMNLIDGTHNRPFEELLEMVDGYLGKQNATRIDSRAID